MEQVRTVRKSGVTHFVCDTEEELLMSIRELISFLPANNMEDAPLSTTLTIPKRE